MTTETPSFSEKTNLENLKISEARLLDVPCYHCGQAIAPDGLVQRHVGGEQRDFCCHGCAGACEAIYDAGLDAFYLRASKDDTWQPPQAVPNDLAMFDHDEIQRQFIANMGDVREITLMADGIHCAACVWLIEHRLAKEAGVLLANVNFTTRRIKLRWDNRVIALSRILHILAELGYASTPYDPQLSQKALEDYNRGLLYRFAFAAFAMMNIMWVSISLYFGAADDAEYKQFFHWVALALATPTLLYSGQPFFVGAWQALRGRRLGMDVSIALGILTTYCYSLYVTLMPESGGAVYFDTLVDFMFFLLLGRYLESISKSKAVDATHRLLELQPKVARKRMDDGSEKLEAVRLLKAGDLVWVHPADRIPVDGVVVEGESHINEAMLTGESRSVHKRVGDKVSAGTHNQEGALLVEVQQLLADSMLGRIIALVEEAQGSKAPIQRTADAVVPWFVATTLSLATFALIFWWWQSGLDTAIMSATAVLIVTCPCAFGLATPMAIAVASGVGARMGILIKHGAVLERLSQATHVVFDKTGTLTTGKMSVTDWHIWHTDEALTQVWEAMATLEQRSEHALATALLAFSEQQGVKARSSQGFVALSGRGVQAQIDGVLWQAGSVGWMREQSLPFSEGILSWVGVQEQQGRTIVCLTRAGDLVATVAVGDALREDAVSVVQALKERGIVVSMVTGDRKAVADAFALQLGGMDVQAEVLPADKEAAVRALQGEGRVVVFVGDGVNDAPALVRADVGIALGSGTEVSVDSAQVVLLNDRLQSVLTSIDLSRVALRTIRQNIGMSLLYNVIMVPLAVSAKLTPLMAAIGMPVSSLLVIGNAARIRGRFLKG
jgi:Cu2+-exporting ATPase